MAVDHRRAPQLAIVQDGDCQLAAVETMQFMSDARWRWAEYLKVEAPHVRTLAADPNCSSFNDSKERLVVVRRSTAPYVVVCRNIS